MWFLFLMCFQGNELTLDSLIELAIKNNRNLAGARYDIEAQTEELATIGWLPDPKLSLGLFIVPVETRVGPQRMRLAAEQEIPYPGFFSVQRELVKTRVNTAERRLEVSEGQLIRDISKLWADLYFLQQKLEINQENLKLMTRMEEVTRSRFRTGQGAYSFVIQAQTQLADLTERVDTTSDEIRAQQARLSGLVGVSGDLPIGTIKLTKHTEQLVDTQPLLAVLDAQMAENRGSQALTRFGFKPKLKAGLTYTGISSGGNVPGSGDDAVMATVGVSLPIWRKRTKARLAVQDAQLKGIEARRQQLQRELQAKIESHRILMEAAKRKVRLYEQTLIPKAIEAMDTTVKSFRAGEVDFTSVIDVQRNLLQFKLTLERARADVHGHRADLNWLGQDEG